MPTSSNTIFHSAPLRWLKSIGLLPQTNFAKPFVLSAPATIKVTRVLCFSYATLLLPTHPPKIAGGAVECKPPSASASLNTNCLIVAYFAILSSIASPAFVCDVAWDVRESFSGPAVCQAFDQSIHYFYYSHPPKNVLDLRIQSSRWNCWFLRYESGDSRWIAEACGFG